MELERVDMAEGVLPMHDDVYSVHIHRRVHADEAILGCGVIHDHWSVLVTAVHCYSRIRDCRQQVGVVPATREVVVVAQLIRQGRLQ